MWQDIPYGLNAQEETISVLQRFYKVYN